MIRIVRTPEGNVEIDSGKKSTWRVYLPESDQKAYEEQKSKKEMIHKRKNPQEEQERDDRQPEGNEIDKTGKKSGRGVYICQNPDCLEKAYQEHRLERSLKTKVSPDIYEELRKDLE